MILSYKLAKRIWKIILDKLFVKSPLEICYKNKYWYKTNWPKRRK